MKRMIPCLLCALLLTVCGQMPALFGTETIQVEVLSTQSSEQVSCTMSKTWI